MSKVAIFSHFDINGIGDAYLEDIFKMLMENMDKVVVVTTSGIDDFPLVSHDKIDVIFRENIGYDFYSYRIGIEYLGSTVDFEQLVLLNDSFYINENFSFQEYLDNSKSSDIYAITSSNQIAFHLQSYFLVFNRKSLRSLWFYRFWNSVYVYKNKLKIVLDYEINLTQSAKISGLSVRAALSYNDDVNPCHAHTEEVISKVGVLKIDVVRNNICDIDIENNFVNSRVIEQHITRTSTAYKDRKLTFVREGIPVGSNFFEWDNFECSSSYLTSSAVILHLYYVNFAEEIKGHLDRIPFTIDLFVTIPDEQYISYVINVFSGSVNRLCVSVIKNKGRDVKPFLDVMKSLDFSDYDLVLKLHSKKSGYSELGGVWRDRIYRGLIPSSASIELLRKAFVKKNIGIASSFSSYLSNGKYWGDNRLRFDKYCNLLNIDEQKRKLFFVGGTMFWFSPKALYPLVNLISLDEFEEENGQRDGTLAHVFERLVCMSALSMNMSCVDVLNVDHPLSARNVRDNKVEVLHD